MDLFTLSLLAVTGRKGRTREMGKELAQEVADLTSPTPSPMEEPGKLYLHQPREPTESNSPSTTLGLLHTVLLLLYSTSRSLKFGAHQIAPNHKVQGQRIATAFPRP